MVNCSAFYSTLRLHEGSLEHVEPFIFYAKLPAFG